MKTDWLLQYVCYRKFRFAVFDVDRRLQSGAACLAPSLRFVSLAVLPLLFSHLLFVCGKKLLSKDQRVTHYSVFDQFHTFHTFTAHLRISHCLSPFDFRRASYCAFFSCLVAESLFSCLGILSIEYILVLLDFFKLLFFLISQHLLVVLHCSLASTLLVCNWPNWRYLSSLNRPSSWLFYCCPTL